MSEPIESLLPDQKKMRHSFANAVSTYDSVAVLQQEVAARMVERLGFIKATPERILDLGCGTGAVRELLKKRYPKAQIVASDIAQPMVRSAQKKNKFLGKKRYFGVCADAQILPFKDQVFDMVISNLMLQWCPDTEKVFSEVRRVCKPEALFMFSTMGPDTLKELRTAWQAVDDLPHVNLFLDMHDLGDALVRSKLADPVMDVEPMVLTYSKVSGLLSDLKRLGANNVLNGRQRGLTGKKKFSAMINAYERYRQGNNLPATYEVVYGHAWVPDLPVNLAGENGEIAIPVSSIRRYSGAK